MDKIIVTTREELQECISSAVREELANHELKLKENVKDSASGKTELMRRDELRDLLKCSYPKIRRLMQKGLPYKRLGRILYFEKSDVLTFLNGKKVTN